VNCGASMALTGVGGNLIPKKAGDGFVSAIPLNSKHSIKNDPLG